MSDVITTTTLVAQNLDALKAFAAPFLNPLYVYQTAGYASTSLQTPDGGGWSYYWDPLETRVDDGVFCIRPNSVAIASPGRFKARMVNGAMDLVASQMTLDKTADYGLYLETTMKTANSFGCKELILPPWRVPIATWVMSGFCVDARVAISGVKLTGRPGSILCGLATNTSLLADVRFITSTPLLPCVAAGSGAGKTLTLSSNGAFAPNNFPLGTVTAVGANQVTISPVANANSTLIPNGTACRFADMLAGGTDAIVTSTNPGTGVVTFSAGTMGSPIIGNKLYRTIYAALNDRIGVCGQVTPRDNGVYKVTQVGDATHPCVLTRATDLNASRQLQNRIGVRAMDGGSNINGIYVLTDQPGGKWTDGYTFIIDDANVSPNYGKQYWSLEPFAQGMTFCPLTDVPWPIVRPASFQPSLSNQNWSDWASPGQTVFPSVNGLAGGPWTDPPTGITYTASPTVPGTTWIVSLGGTPSDQGGMYQTFKCRVEQIDASNNVTINRPVPLKTIYVHSNSNGTNNPPYNTTNMYPSYGLNQSAHTTDNTYCVVIQDAGDLGFENVVWDGVSPTFALCDNVITRNCEVRNAHIGIQYFGCGTHRNYDITGKHITAYSFAGETSGALVSYGWWIQSNTSTDGLSIGTTVDGLTADFCDFEAETEERFQATMLTLAPYPAGIPRAGHTILGTTPNVIKREVVNGLIVRGYSRNTIIVSQPVNDFKFDVCAPNGDPRGCFADATFVSGRMRFKGRDFDMSSRRPWQTMIPLGIGQTKTVFRPFSGLWANTRVFIHGSLSGLTLFGITDIGLFVSDFAPSLRALPSDVWSVGPWDALGDFYPNGLNGSVHSIQITTSGAQPAGSYIIIATDIIPEQNRGDGYTTVNSTITDAVPGVGAVATLMKVVPDVGPQMTLYGTAAPGTIPQFPGQRFIDFTAGAIYEAIDVTAVADWKKLTP